MAEIQSSLEKPLIDGSGMSEKAAHLMITDTRELHCGYRLLGEIRQQLRIALPMICVNLLWVSLNVVSIMFVGHLGELILSGASLANSLASVTGATPIFAMATALETLCGQAYGAKQYHMVGIFFQRAILVLNIIAIPVAFLWWNMSFVLRILGQNHEVAAVAGVYSRWIIPNVFAIACTQPLLKYLQTQSIVLPMALVSLCVLLVHIPLCWLLIFKLGWGLKGSAIASDISNWLIFLLLLAYVRISPSCKKTWTPISKEAYRDLWSFLKLAILSAAMICLEIYTVEILVILSGLLPDPQLETSTFTINLNILVLSFMIPFGLSAALSTRVANELGAGRPQAAKFAVYATILMGLVEGLVMSILLMSVLRNAVGWAFSNDPKVVKYVAHCMPFVAAMISIDAIQGVLSGVARGGGWQDAGAYANLGAFYLAGLPCAAILAFVYHLNDSGLWIGLILGMVIKTAALILITGFTNWDKLAVGAMERIESTNISSRVLPLSSVDNKEQTLVD